MDTSIPNLFPALYLVLITYFIITTLKLLRKIFTKRFGNIATELMQLYTKSVNHCILK